MKAKATLIYYSFLFALSVTAMAQSPALIDPPFHYPLPEGKYQVGTRFLTLSDKSRPDIYTENTKDFRQLSMRIWYPANPKTGSQPLSYYKKPVADNFIEMGLFYDAFLQDIALQASCSFLDAPIYNASDPFPLVIYSSSGVMNANIFLFENLASHGYVVVSVGHPHWCVFYYDDLGNPYFPDYDNDPYYHKMWEEEGSEAVGRIKEQITVAVSVDEKRKLLHELNEAMPVEISDVKLWVQDFDFITGELARFNAEGSIFKGMLGLDKIGIMGYSKGGVAAAHACLTDCKYAAGINLSGFMFGDIQYSPIKVPFMNIESEEAWCKDCESINDIIYHNAEADVYMIQIKDATHGNFTDLSAYKNYITADFDGLLGPIDGPRFLEIQSAYILNFLDQYLKGIPSFTPEKLQDKYEEVRLKTNMGT